MVTQKILPIALVGISNSLLTPEPNLLKQNVISF